MKANRKSWKIDPISREKVAMDIYAEYSAVEYEKMSEGCGGWVRFPYASAISS